MATNVRITDYSLTRIKVNEDGVNIFYLDKDGLTVAGDNGNLVLTSNNSNQKTYNFSVVKLPKEDTLEELVDVIQGYIDEFLYSGNIVGVSNINVESTANSTSVVPTTSAPYSGTAEDVLGYAGSTVILITTQSTTSTGTYYFGYSDDANDFSAPKGFEVSLAVTSTTGLAPQTLRTVKKYFRVRYVPDDNNLTGFCIKTVHHKIAPEIITRFLSQSITDDEPVKNVRAIIAGKNPVGNYANKATSGLSNSNNSTTPLNASATYTGGFEDMTLYSNICINIMTDQEGSLFVDFSQDGTNVTSTATRTYTSTSSAQSYIFSASTRYVRIRFTNTSASNQTVFKLQTIYKADAVGETIQAANTPLTPTFLSKAVVAIPSDGVKTTYSACVTSLSPANTPRDIFTITGSATKNVKILSVVVSGTKTTAANVDILLIKRSTANSGGTSNAETAVPHDSNNIAATAVVRSYTANPSSLGTAVGTVRSEKIFIPSSATASEGGIKQWDFGRLGQAITLRGTAQVFAVNLNSVSAVGGSFNIWITWAEE